MTTISYPFDSVGTASTNLISSEQQLTQTFPYLGNYLIIPDYAPYYGSSLVLQYTDANTPLKTLVLGIDYLYSFPFWGASRSIGAAIYGGITLLSTVGNGTLYITYQTIGGIWCDTPSSVLANIFANINDPREVIWDVVTTVQEIFPAINNSLNLSDTNIDPTYNLDYFISELGNLEVSILQIPPPTINIEPFFNAVPIHTCMPEITSPTAGANNVGTTIIITASAFSVFGGDDTQASANWEIATDSAFNDIVYNSIGDTVNLNSWTVSGLSYSTTYYVRVQYTGHVYGTSIWSGVVSFTNIP